VAVIPSDWPFLSVSVCHSQDEVVPPDGKLVDSPVVYGRHRPQSEASPLPL